MFNWIPVYNNESEEDGNDTNNISISTLYATKIPDQVIEVAVEAGSNIPDSKTLYSAFKLWLAMFSNTSILPLPSLKRVIPQYHAKWNATKSGSDTTTKLMDNLSIRQPHINLETAAVCRLLHLGFVFIHRINAIFTANEDLNYPTITHFRNAASHDRSTYYETIVEMYRIFSSQVTAKRKVPSGLLSPPITRQTRIGNAIPHLLLHPQKQI